MSCACYRYVLILGKDTNTENALNCAHQISNSQNEESLDAARIAVQAAVQHSPRSLSEAIPVEDMST